MVESTTSTQNLIFGTVFRGVAMAVIRVRFRMIKYLDKITELVREEQGFESRSI